MTFHLAPSAPLERGPSLETSPATSPTCENRTIRSSALQLFGLKDC